MHAGQGLRYGGRQLVDHRLRIRRVGVEVEAFTQQLARAENVALGQRRVIGPALREEIAAEERPRRLLQQQAGFPAMREVRGGDPADGAAPERDGLTVLQRTRRPVGDVVDPLAARLPQSGAAAGETARKSLIAPHSSAS